MRAPLAHEEFEAEETTKVEAYETLQETAKKWREELQHGKLPGYEIYQA